MRQDALLVALTFAAGAADAVNLLALDVLTAVMTGNLVLLGLAGGRGAMATALRSLIALAGYAVGVIVGARVAGRGPDPISSPRVQRALVIELGLQGGFLAGWAATGGAPDDLAAAVLIAVSGIVMGIQSATVQTLGSRISTTYVTGMLTTLLGDLTSRPGTARDLGLHLAAVLALVAGALTGAVVLLTARVAAPAIALVPIAAVAVLARRSGH
jgi:uncharacterized membrane protein YoaK (UPF0700 family)